MNLFEKAMISSLNPRILWSIHKQEPRITVGALWGSFCPWYLRAGWWRKLIGVQALHPCYDLVTSQLVADAHARGLRVHTWTVNEPADIQHMRDMGVDLIMGDYPERLASK